LFVQEQAGIRHRTVTGVLTCALAIYSIRRIIKLRVQLICLFMKSAREKFKVYSKKANELCSQFYYAPYRAAIARAKREEDDLFMLLVFAELMGMPNPASWYTLELQPILLERFHEWHTSMGMVRSRLGHYRISYCA